MMTSEKAERNVPSDLSGETHEEGQEDDRAPGAGGLPWEAAVGVAVVIDRNGEDPGVLVGVTEEVTVRRLEVGSGPAGVAADTIEGESGLAVDMAVAVDMVEKIVGIMAVARAGAVGVGTAEKIAEIMAAVGIEIEGIVGTDLPPVEVAEGIAAVSREGKEMETVETTGMIEAGREAGLIKIAAGLVGRAVNPGAVAMGSPAGVAAETTTKIDSELARLKIGG